MRFVEYREEVWEGDRVRIWDWLCPHAAFARLDGSRKAKWLRRRARLAWLRRAKAGRVATARKAPEPQPVAAIHWSTGTTGPTMVSL